MVGRACSLPNSLLSIFLFFTLPLCRPSVGLFGQTPMGAPSLTLEEGKAALAIHLKCPEHSWI